MIITNQHILDAGISLLMTAVLQQAFDEFYYVAEQNHFFALTKEPCITYKGGNPTVCTPTAEILLTDYDGQSVFLITNNAIKDDEVATIY